MILPGVTRDSVLALAREHESGKGPIDGMPEGKFIVSERPVTMKEVKDAARDGRLVEFFGTGALSFLSASSFLMLIVDPFPPRRHRCGDKSGRPYRVPWPGPAHSDGPGRDGPRLASRVEEARQYSDGQARASLERVGGLAGLVPVLSHIGDGFILTCI